MKIIDVSCIVIQISTGAVLWVYVAGIAFTQPASFENYAPPIAIAAGGSVVLSGVWTIASSIPSYLLALFYSLPYLLWTLFQSVSGGDLVSTIFWLCTTVGIYICGMVASFTTKILRDCLFKSAASRNFDETKSQ